MTEQSSGRRLRIPARFVDGAWEYDAGGVVPFEEGAPADLVIDPLFIADKAFLNAMQRKGQHKVLDEGVELLVCLTVRSMEGVAKEHHGLLTWYKDWRGRMATTLFDFRFNPGTLAFAPVSLAGPSDKQARRFSSEIGGLWLMTEGAEAVGLASTTIRLPSAISAEPVLSLNHAYTKLSEVFEPKRSSHTGNIYRQVLYRERNNKWYPLNVLRNRVLANQERDTARELWGRFMAQLGTSGDDGAHWQRT